MLLRKRSMWRDVSPRGAIADFLAVYKSAGPNRWRFALGALVCTGLGFSLVVLDENRILPRAPTIIYINSWHAGRTDAEIQKSNLLNQQIKDEKQAEQDKSDKEVRDMYKTLGRISGMDVDAIQRKADAERAAAVKAQQAEQDHAAALRHPAVTAPATH